MAPRIRKVKVVNNNGSINFGNRACFTPFSVSKGYNGSGGASEGVIVNGQRTEELAGTTQEVIEGAGFQQEDLPGV